MNRVCYICDTSNYIIYTQTTFICKKCNIIIDKKCNICGMNCNDKCLKYFENILKLD